jgi:Na+-translocating ferredoxin:NAD+ oxidoreductase RnfD subunit
VATLIATRKPASQPFTQVALRFFRSPKGILLLVLGLLTTIGLIAVGASPTLPMVLSAMFVAALTDVALALCLRDDDSFPSGALLTGLIIALVLSPATSPWVAGLVAAVAIGSKYVFRTRWSNVFNPAAVGLVVAYFVFGTGESWWGALPDLPAVAIVVVVVAGLFIADRVNKIPMALAFLGAFYALGTVSSFFGGSAVAQELFRTPDVNAALFFALFMLDDPPTSPVRYHDQIVFGAIAAVASYAVFLLLGGVYYLLAGVLVANLWETLRRLNERSRAKAPPTPAVRQPTAGLVAGPATR